MALSPFLTRLLQSFLKLLDFLGQLHEILVHGITFLSAFPSGAEIGFILSVLFEPMTITSVVCGMRTPMLLAQVVMLLKTDFLGNLDCRIGTRAFLPFLALAGKPL